MEDQALDLLQMIALEKLRSSSTNPRRMVSPDDLIELTESIRMKGIIEPLIVRQVDSAYEIVAGERRSKAARAAGLNQAPCLIRSLNDVQVLEIQIIDNLQRSDVHPLDEADGYRMLMDRAKYDIDRIASEIGKSVSYVYQRVKLAELIGPAKEAFWKGKITPSHAVLIARIQSRDQERALAFALKTWQGYEGEHEYWNLLNPEIEDVKQAKSQPDAPIACSVRDLADFIAARIHLDLRDAAFDKKDPDLVPAAGSCTQCPKRTGFSKELFEDIAKHDICTDPACFSGKQQAQFENLKATLKKEGKKFIEITQDLRKPQGHSNSITERSFTTIKGKPCKFARVGIYVDGSSKGKTTMICAAKKECKQHWGAYQKARAGQRISGARTDGMSYEEQQQRREEKKRKAWKRFRPIAEEIYRRLPDKLPKGFEARMAKILGPHIAPDLDESRPRGFKLTPIQIINLALLSDQYRLDVSWSGDIHPDLYKAAKSLGIRFEAILQKVSDQEKAAAKLQTSAKSKRAKQK